jgi:hypothetical protein
VRPEGLGKLKQFSNLIGVSNTRSSDLYHSTSTTYTVSCLQCVYVACMHVYVSLRSDGLNSYLVLMSSSEVDPVNKNIPDVRKGI